MSANPDLSQNEFESYLALALEGNGLPQGMCKAAARAGLVMALDGRDPTDQALGWSASDLNQLLPLLNQSPPRRVRVSTVSSISWAKIKQLAANTYVPESEASKLSGAGAGTHDND